MSSSWIVKTHIPSSCWREEKVVTLSHRTACRCPHHEQATCCVSTPRHILPVQLVAAATPARTKEGFDKRVLASKKNSKLTKKVTARAGFVPLRHCDCASAAPVPRSEVMAHDAGQGTPRYFTACSKAFRVYVIVTRRLTIIVFRCSRLPRTPTTPPRRPPFNSTSLPGIQLHNAPG